jgi:hypothetical protein
MEKLKKYQAAFREIEKKKRKRGVIVHLIIYCIINALLIYSDFSNQGNQFHWSFFPLIGWGIGLTAHFVFAYKMFDKIMSKKEENAEKLAGIR